MVDVAHHLWVSTAAVTKIVDRLEGRGLVVRRPAAARRARSLSDSGQHMPRSVSRRQKPRAPATARYVKRAARLGCARSAEQAS